MESVRSWASSIAVFRPGRLRLEWIYYGALLAAWLVPGLVLLVASVFALNLSTPSEIYRFVAIDNFSTALSSVEFWNAITKTVGLVVVVAAVAALLGACIAA